MKTLKTLLSVVAVAAIFSTGAFAQTGQTGDAVVSAAAEVITAFDFAITNVDFGGVATGSAATLATTNVGTDANVGLNGNGTQIGQIVVTGVQGATLDVSFGTATLSDGSGNTLLFTPTLEEMSGNSSMSTGDDITLDGSGNFTIEIGGSLPAPSVAGSYDTGNAGGTDLTVTFEYL